MSYDIDLIEELKLEATMCAGDVISILRDFKGNFGDFQTSPLMPLGHAYIIIK